MDANPFAKLPRRRYAVTLALFIGILLARSSHASDTDFFETNIRPVLAEHCYTCHGADVQEGGLALHDAESFERGMHKQDDGRLTQLLRNEAPFEHPRIKLSEAARNDLVNWLQEGAPWPKKVESSMSSSMAEFVAKAKESHWAFQPIGDPVVPNSDDSNWTRSPIDHFILDALNDAKLKPSSEAPPATLLRRMYFDLIGLPPSYDEVKAFEQNYSEDTIEQIIDQLLASPHYGERWGRYWLDVARYSDTLGFGTETDQYFPFPHTYRDYVIRAFNDDLPIDRFITEQLAADKLDLGDDPRPLAAMGFITVGRQFPGDRNATLDDQIDVVTRGSQGLTVSCARCHDHKFDPIPTADYYSLYGVFRSSHLPSDLPLIEEPDETSEAFQLYQEELTKRETELADFFAALTDEQRDDPETKKKIETRRAAIRKHIHSHPGRPDRAMILADTNPLFDPFVFERGKEGMPGDAIPRRYLAVLAEDDRIPFEDGSGRLDLARAIASEENPLTARVFVNRVWMHHFGQALVGTPSDFGYQGERPTHPELLDHLARTFMDDGWSLKKLHKRIMMSSTYRQSSVESPDAQSVDPENRLLSHANRRRLDFEAMRDSLLVASDRLDRRFGGHSVDITKAPFPTRRAVYAEIDRQNLPTLFSTFDFPTPGSHSDRRFQTTVPQQSLYMLNNAFVAEQARAVASQYASTENADARIGELYRSILARHPSDREIELGAAFVESMRDAPPLEIEMPSEETDWQYGYGRVDESTGQTVSFTEFPYWSGEAYQGDGFWPEGDFGWAKLTKHGGQPGDENHAVIRRWTSPVDSTISFIGELHYFSSAGNGVRAFVVSSREGIIWSGEVSSDFILTEFKDRPIQKGDTVDLVVTSNGGEAEDAFRWHPRLYLSGEDATQYPKQDWLTRFDFQGPPPKAPDPLDAWSQYAQVLLMSNEFIYLD